MDMKKWFRKKDKNGTPIKQSGIYKFLDKEGFYIVLFLCVCIVAVTAVWVTKTNIDRLATEDKVPSKTDNQLAEVDDSVLDSFPEKEVMEEVEESPTIVIEDLDREDESIPTVASQKEEEEETVSQTEAAPPKLVDSQEKIEEQEEEVSSSAAMAMIKPLKGELGMKYAVDSLTYSKTLEQYTTHNGVDIEAPLDTPVMAALDGEVIEVVLDSRLGLTIAISHANNIITRYANLSTDEMVDVGDWVEKGQVISGVGKSALFEISDPPHLHFEILVDGKHVDPSLYIPVN